MALERILVLDDDLLVRRTLREVLRRMGFVALDASTIAEAEAVLANERVDLVFADVGLPDGNGEDLLKRLESAPEAPFIVMMTGRGSVESAVRCIRAGAFDYLLKPFTADIIEVILRKADSFGQLQRVNRYMTSGGDDSQLLGASRVMEQLREVIAKVAPTDATVLVTGESGTGKEMVAMEVFRNSPRSRSPFIKVNCAAINETLMESEFFGHERGAFTGATERREGRFELAHGGTLLLDEISEVSINLQAKLLRVLQEREFERVGGTKTIKTDVRVLATSNRDLGDSVRRGRFREDLYYRLNVVPIHVPPLRERDGDAILLAKDFLVRAARKHGVRTGGFSAGALAAIDACRWPGNVREVQNTVERAVILVGTGRQIEPLDMGLTVSGLPMSPSHSGAAPEPDNSSTATLAEIERAHILGTLERLNGNRTHAAAALGISLRTMRNKLALYRDEQTAAKQA
ncbi:MAG TPA: sigma-54 dependent transcriptional regulator [Opitutaceae bacterium]